MVLWDGGGECGGVLSEDTIHWVAVLVLPLMVDAFAMTFAWCYVNGYTVNTVP